MAEESSRTLIASVLFIDLIGYSKRAVSEQHELKQVFNGFLASALDLLNRRDRVIVDTGDGAAVVFLGDPEEALIVGIAMREHAGRVAMRLGINLGPIRLMNDLNDQVNVVGDGINVAQRVMSFAEPGQLLVSSNYYEVVSRLADHYQTMFTRAGRRQDKHVREHEVYSVADTIHLGAPSPAPGAMSPFVSDAVYTPSEEAGDLAQDAPAKVLDAGPNLLISGSSSASVRAALERLVREGAAQISPATLVGNRWIAACTHPGKSSECTVEEFGLKRVITGPTRQAVADKVAEMMSFGATLDVQIELVDGVWTAVCDTRSLG